MALDDKLKKVNMESVIAVVGTGQEDNMCNTLAEEVGSLIASEGKVLINGGLGGVMQASAKGCKTMRGTTVGMLPGLDPFAANPYIDIPITTGMGELRNFLIVRSASAVIAIGGSYGTLSEVGLALKLGKPVIGLNTWDIPGIVKAENAADAVRKAIKAIGPRNQ